MPAIEGALDPNQEEAFEIGVCHSAWRHADQGLGVS